MQVLFGKSVGENVIKGIFSYLVLAFCNVYFEVPPTKLGYNLAAYSARKAEILRRCSGGTAYNGNCGKVTLAFAYCLKNCGAFGTVCGSVGGVFNIAPAKNFAVFKAIYL